MTDHDVKYMHKIVQTLRGTESRSIAKWQKLGWELVEQEQGRVRTALHFRRPKPNVPWKLVGAAAAVIVVLIAVGGIASAVGSGDDEPAKEATATSEAASASASPSQTPAVTPSETPSETASETPTSEAPTSAAPEVPAVLTPANNKEFAKLMRGDYCSGAIGKFATKYAGHKIAFDGSVENVMRFGTRYDILLGPGDKGPMTTVGPAFKYQGTSIYSLNFVGSQPATIHSGDRFHLLAKVYRYRANQCLFYLDPVSTVVR